MVAAMMEMLKYRDESQNAPTHLSRGGWGGGVEASGFVIWRSCFLVWAFFPGSVILVRLDKPAM